MRTIKDLFKDAMDIQNACNLCGLSQRFAKVMIELNDLVPSGTDDRNKHAIVTLWLDKFNSLNGIQFDEAKISQAYQQAFDILKEE